MPDHDLSLRRDFSNLIKRSPFKMMIANIIKLQKNTPNLKYILFAGYKKICKKTMRERL